MPTGLLKSTIGRVCFAVAVVQVAVLAQAASAWGQQRTARGPAPITYSTADPGAAGVVGGAASSVGAGQGAVTWRYPDQPDVIYRASPTGANTEARPAAAAADPAPQVLDLRRAPTRSAARTAEVAEAVPVSDTERPAWLEEERVGPPYEEAGQWYVPTPQPGFSDAGALAVYDAGTAAGTTASGEPYDPQGLTAAHPTLPIPSLLQVTDTATGREVIVRLNDRGPFEAGRVVALSPGAARALGAQDGAQVEVRYLGPAPRRQGVQTAAAEVPQAPPLSPAEDLRPDTPIASLPVPPNVSQALVRQAAYTPSAQAGPPVRGGYTVQLGAFANLENAHALRARLRTAGVVSIEPTQTARGELFRVRLGPFATEAEAEAAQDAATRLGVSGGVVRPVR